MSESAVEQLRHEHELVLMVAGAMEREAERIERTGRADREPVAEMVAFARGFTDACHHAKEEKLLFPLLERRAESAGGPLSVMQSEHAAGRAAVKAIDDDLGRLERGEPAPELAADLTAYARLLRLHIEKEDDVLFPLADEVLVEGDKRWLAEEFERIEREETGAGVHEWFGEMARRLAAMPD